MRKDIAPHPHFISQKTKLKLYINNSGHTFLYIPKYHCELNSIEHWWSHEILELGTKKKDESTVNCSE